METIKLDLIPGKKMPSLHASQYDDGRKHGIDLFENGIAYKLDGTETLTINERKVDNNICSMDIENTFTGSSHIEFASFLQMCACAGSNFCELRISKGDVDIGTLNFILEVEPDPTADGIESESEIRNLERQIEEITEEVIGDDYYTAEQTDDAIANATEGKADTTYVNEELAKKADKTDTYTKLQVDNALNNKMNKANPTGTGSIAVGQGVVASGAGSQAFGVSSTASGLFSHAEGFETTASGESSHAEGYLTTASGQYSHAEGCQTIASGRFQHVSGKYNVADNNNQYLEIIGNGENSYARSNARTLDWDGNETLAGDLTYNGNKSLSSEISRLDGRIDNLPAPMIFKGTLGVGGTIQSLPTASASNEGFTYKVITDGTYAGQTAKVGDVFTSNGSAWVLIPSGDEDNDTWRAVKVNGVEKLGNGISSGAVDFVGSDNIEVEFDANGNKVGFKTKNIYTKTEVDSIVSDAIYNVLPDDTASGSVANFETDLALPIKSLEVDVNAVQESGTPTPQSPKAISGVSAVNVTQCGKNLFDVNNITLLGVASGSRWGYSISKAGTYKASVSYDGSAFLYCVIKAADGTFGSSIYLQADTTITPRKITVNEGETLIFYNASANQTEALTKQKMSNAQIEVGTTTTEHEPYNGSTTLINLGGTYYGGHFTQDKAGHRQFEVTWCGLTDLGSLPWGSASNGRIGCNPTDMEVVSSGAVIGNIKSDCYAPDTQNNVYNRTNDKTIAMTNNLSTRMMLYDSDLGNKTSTEVKTALSGKNVIYGLLEPYTIDLPDGEPIITINGTNNIFADTGDTSVVFKSSVNDYVSAHSGGNLLGMGGVYLGGAKSGGGEEEPDEGEDTEKTKLDEPKEEIKTIGDTKKLGGE